MSAMVRKWPVLLEQPVSADDLDADGAVRDDSVSRWVDAASADYLGRCALLQRVVRESGLELRAPITHRPPGASLGRPSSVVVSAGATEIRPDSFSIAVRLRPAGGDHEEARDATCLVRLHDPAGGDPHPITDALRDELIALEQAARHYN
jgi:acyl-CoA thioesterase FadM